MDIKLKIKRLICRWFGHKDYTERYASKCTSFFGYPYPKSDRHYIVVEDIICERCGRIHSRHLTQPMTRAELLKNGWFITNNE